MRAAAELRRIDEHATLIDANPDAVWRALGDHLGGPTGRATAFGARILGAEPAAASGDPLEAGATVAGFEIVRAERPRELALRGRHRFSQYALIFHIDAAGGRTRLGAETRAEFPGGAGRIYRTLVIGTRLHVVAVRRMLASIRRIAERGSIPAKS